MTQKQITLYLTRHGKTMFNTLDKVQGWSDTPLTTTGASVVSHLGKGLKTTPFVAAYSSDSGRAIETAKIILNENQDSKIKHHTDKRIREWNFGSFEGSLNSELTELILKDKGCKTPEELLKTHPTFKDFSDVIYELDTANWAETYETLTQRIHSGFTDIAKKHACAKGGNLLVVSHGLTIANFLNLIDPTIPVYTSISNASVSKVEYQNGTFTIKTINDTSYIEQGKNS